MAGRDEALFVAGTAASPLDYTVPGSVLFRLKSVYAEFDGTGAGGTFLPAIKLTSDSGHVNCIASDPSASVAVGGSAAVTWFPGVRVGSSHVLTTTAPVPSGQTILPLAVTMGIRTVQPSPANFGASVAHFGFRAVMPRSGVLHDLAVYISVPAGNIEVGLLNTVATTRTILYKTGSVAATASHAWQIIGDPALAVSAGDQVDVSYAATSASNTIMWVGGEVNTGTDAPSGALPANFVPAPGGGKNTICWADSTSPIPYGGTTTVAESSLVAQQNIPLVIGRISDS